jgi:hypothetical protein
METIPIELSRHDPRIDQGTALEGAVRKSATVEADLKVSKDLADCDHVPCPSPAIVSFDTIAPALGDRSILNTKMGPADWQGPSVCGCANEVENHGSNIADNAWAALELRAHRLMERLRSISDLDRLHPNQKIDLAREHPRGA